MSAASGRQIRLAVVGASGTVGTQIAELIRARDFPHAELRLFARESGSISEGMESGADPLPVARFGTPSDLAGFDIAFLALPQGGAGEIIAARPGPVLIDLSAATRPPFDAAPLVAPGLTSREHVRELERLKLFAIPHPAALVIATVLSATGTISGFAGATIMLAAAAYGHEAASKLFKQSVDLLNARLDVADGETQIAFNTFLPEDGHELAYAITAQATALMGSGPALAIGVVRVPAFHGGAVALHVPARDDMSEWPARLRTAPGIILVESDDATGFVDTTSHDAAVVRMREYTGGAVLWCVFDSARIAALSAIWIAESLASTLS
jgi:aspartate-semialdehyde dehydrogenase